MIIIVITVGLFTASFLLQDKVTGLILKSLNKDIQTKFEFESAHLSFLRKFPKASLDLKNVLVHSSPGFKASSFGKINTDTLLFSRSVIAEFSITDIIHGIYNIDRIAVKQGRLNIFTDTAGLVNYEISADTGKVKNDNFTIILDRINVYDLTATYNNLATRLVIKSFVDNGRLKSRISGNEIDFTADGDMHIDNFTLYGFTISRRIDAAIDLALHSSPKGILFSKGSLVIDKINYELSGFISQNDTLDLVLRGDNIDISGIKKYLPEKYNKKIADYNPSGILNIRSTIKGPVSRTSNPGIEIHFDLSRGHVSYLNSALNINVLSFKGYFSNGAKTNPTTSVVALNDITGILGSAQYSGSLSLSDLSSPVGSLHLKGKLIPSELREFFGLRDISTARGSIDFVLDVSGNVPIVKKFSVSDFLALDPTANLNFNSFGIGLNNDRIMVDNVNGNLFVSDTVWAKDFKFSFRKQECKLNGTFINLMEWLTGKPVILTAAATINAKTIRPEFLFPSLSDTSSTDNSAYILPRDIVVDLDFSFDRFEYKTFSAEKIRGSMSYKPGIFNFKTLKLNSMEGVVSGNGFVLQNKDKSFLGRGTFDLKSIDINEAFKVFHNFGQNFIKAENLAGNLSGDISVLIPADSLLKPDIKSISAEGKYTVEKGALLDFAPVEELSSFIEISELKNIHFENLENDFFIRNNSLYIPQMDVRSSAASLTVSGKHSFDNNYEYHIKILLSEMLSKKIHKPKPNTTEFGAVSDDGLGRTSMLLKIVNKGSDVKVSYDMKAAGGQIKNDIKTERQTLKTILKQEYGWYKKDTVATPKETTSAPRFKIAWGDEDTAKVEEVEKPVEKKESPFKNLFRKK
ncbi:MAG: AsmA-like C-terminal region-containing protein [Bacteroidales bacterium]